VADVTANPGARCPAAGSNTPLHSSHRSRPHRHSLRTQPHRSLARLADNRQGPHSRSHASPWTRAPPPLTLSSTASTSCLHRTRFTSSPVLELMEAALDQIFSTACSAVAVQAVSEGCSRRTRLPCRHGRVWCRNLASTPRIKPLQGQPPKTKPQKGMPSATPTCTRFSPPLPPPSPTCRPAPASPAPAPLLAST